MLQGEMIQLQTLEFFTILSQTALLSLSKTRHGCSLARSRLKDNLLRGTNIRCSSVSIACPDDSTCTAADLQYISAWKVLHSFLQQLCSDVQIDTPHLSQLGLQQPPLHFALKLLIVLEQQRQNLHTLCCRAILYTENE